MKLVNVGMRYVYFKCPQCLFWTSRTKSGEWPFYDYTDAPTFDAGHAAHWADMKNEAIQIMTHKFALFPNLKVNKFLDVGCSEGVYVAACDALGVEAHGVEVDTVKVDRAVKRGLRVCVPEDFNDAGTFDFVLIRHVIEHVPDFFQLTSLALRYLKPNGILCIETPNQAGLKTLTVRHKVVDDRYVGHLYPPTHLNAFEKQTYRNLAKRFGRPLIKLTTYSPSDPRWVFTSQYHRTGLVPKLQALSAKIGFGENLAAFYGNQDV
jgi:2-polyprenyl-3-methyl-5-hydroxy-6-metoxy-1,4-benzoquinol methylase